MVLVGNLVSYLRVKSESESVTPDTAFCFNSKDMHIIENRQWGTSVPDDMEQAHTKMTGQADNEHLDISLICHLFSFLL
jgi:hypothetical protein